MKLTQSETVRFIHSWLKRKGYDQDFKQDISQLLQDNRRRTRCSNITKYGSIPYEKAHSGKVYYDAEDIKKFLNERLEPICKELEHKRFELAAKALKGAYTPYAT